MEQIYKKINNHEYLNNEDIKRIISIESNSKIKVLFVKNEESGMSLDFVNSTIRIDNKYKSKKLIFFVGFSEAKLKVKDYNNPSTFLVDLYNIYLMSTLFHELEHVKQYKSLNKPLSFKNKIINENFEYYMFKNHEIYLKNHDLYYHEYQATINSLIRTLDMIYNKCNNLNKTAINEFNREMASVIFHSYGNKYHNDKQVSKIYNKFCSPICHTKYLSRLWNNPNERKIMSICINDLKKNSKTEYQKLVNGLPLTNDTLEYIYDVCTRYHNTFNLLEDIKRDKQKIK